MMAAMLSPLASLGLLLIAAPLMPGIIARTKATVAGRRGQPVWQLYADLWKLVRRGTVYSTTTTWMFRLGPIVLLASTIAAALLLPLDGRHSVIATA
jgi:formate hydrogenlyase subunit 4